MKISKLLKLGLLATPLLLTGCNSSSDSGGGSTPGGGGGGEDDRIEIRYYLDYTFEDTEETYATLKIKNGSKIGQPNEPQSAPSKEFPIFVGWSKKPIIDDTEDLWNFDSDVVNITDGSKTFSIYGIWFASGEH